jgi:hypothetical protein
MPVNKNIICITSAVILNVGDDEAIAVLINPATNHSCRHGWQPTFLKLTL